MDTRHNFGFLCLEELSRLYRQSVGHVLVEEASQSQIAQWERWRLPNASEVVLLWPLTYMNLCGRAVDFLAHRLGASLPQEELLVVVDDMSLPLGQLRLRKKGSSGGHNGLKSMEALLGNSEYPRLRLGIGQPPPAQEVVDFVLSPFAADEGKTARSVVAFAALSASEWVESVSFEALVGKVNGWRAATEA